jgi:hypothetical protein
MMRKAGSAAVVLLLPVLAACSSDPGQDDLSNGSSAQTPAASPTQTPAATVTSSSPTGAPLLTDGPVVPGRYRFVVPDTCDPKVNHDGWQVCPKGKSPALPALDITVPEGWDAAPEVLSLFPADGRDTTSPNSPALALGWTNHWVGLNSHPCSQVEHQRPDIVVGPSVGDFVDAVVAHPLLNVTEPRPVTLGRFHGQFFSLLGPKDISGCEEWRPWDPAPYLQGPQNRWDLWVMNIKGVRVVIMAEYFPETQRGIKAELQAMAESIRFTP